MRPVNVLVNDIGNVPVLVLVSVGAATLLIGTGCMGAVAALDVVVGAAGVEEGELATAFDEDLLWMALGWVMGFVSVGEAVVMVALL